MGSFSSGGSRPYSSGNKEMDQARAELARTEAFGRAMKEYGKDSSIPPSSSGDAQRAQSTDAHASEAAGHESHADAAPASPSHASEHASSAADSRPTDSYQSSRSASAAPSTPAQGAAASSQPRASSAQAASSSPAARDTMDTATVRSSSATPATASTAASAQTANAGEHLSASLDASMARDLANIAGSTQATTVRVESLGNVDAMTRELLAAIKGSGNPADMLKQDPAVQTALVAMTQKAVDNIPHLLNEADPAKGVKLFVPDAQAAQAAEARLLASDSARIQALQELTGGPDWPHMMLEGLGQAGEAWRAQAPGKDPLANAMMALFGREASVGQAGQGADALGKLASLANPPLGLPAAGMLRTDDNQLAGFSVHSTHLNGENRMMVTVLDVPASVEAGHEVLKTMEAEQFAKAVYVLVVPDGRPAVAIQKQREADLQSLGLAGCCLTASGGSDSQRRSPLRTVATRGGAGGLLENRCITCARAQQLCQPKKA